MGRVLFSFVLIGTCILTASAQTDRKAQAEEVKTAVFAYPGKTDDVSLMLRSLVQLKGPIARIDTDNFDLQFRTKGGKRVFQTIRYTDVMYLRYGKTELSFIAPPEQKQFGNWRDINAVYPGTRIFIILEGDRTFEGWSNSATEENLIVLSEGANRRVEIPLKDVVAFYGVLGRSGGAKSGAAWGAEGILHAPLLGLAATGVGAILGEALRNSGTPILIYSK